MSKTPAAPPPAEDENLDDFLSTGEDVAESPHPILSVEEVASAKKRARDVLDKERRAAAMKQVQEEETQRLRREEGLTSGITDEDKLVWMTIDLPEWCDRIPVNGLAYFHGHSYQVPLHVYRSLSEQIQNSWRSNDLADGKSMLQTFQSRRDTKINGANGIVDRAPPRFDSVN